MNDAEQNGPLPPEGSPIIPSEEHPSPEAAPTILNTAGSYPPPPNGPAVIAGASSAGNPLPPQASAIGSGVSAVGGYPPPQQGPSVGSGMSGVGYPPPRGAAIGSSTGSYQQATPAGASPGYYQQQAAPPAAAGYRQQPVQAAAGYTPQQPTYPQQPTPTAGYYQQPAQTQIPSNAGYYQQQPTQAAAGYYPQQQPAPAAGYYQQQPAPAAAGYYQQRPTPAAAGYYQQPAPAYAGAGYPPQGQRYPNANYQTPYYAPPMPKKKKRIWPLVLAIVLALLLGLVVLFSVALCSLDDTTTTTTNTTNSWATLTSTDHSATLAERYDPNDTWAIYWYLCGSDLESEAGFASTDINEMLAVNLPSNVFVVIEAGGALKWQNGMDASCNNRYLYNSEGLHLIEKIPRASMGSVDTLESFLRFCNEQYPADHKVVVFWNHGGGSVAGVMFDEYYGNSLSLPDIREAFSAVSTPSKDNPPYEMVGFDACLMATIDMADTLNGFARWMVASEELEPGLGWNYTGFLQALADDPGIGGARLGQAICDSYYSACAARNMADEITLSVVDLRQVDALMDAYHNVGAESLIRACENTTFFSDFGRAAKKAQNYGGNSAWDGYSNMVDLGDLIWQSGSELLPEHGAEMLNALDRCVVYQVTGTYRDRATGLSCYYNYSGDYYDYMGFAKLRGDDPFRWLYFYELTGELSAEGIQFVQNLAFIYAPEQSILPRAVESAESDDLEDYPVKTTEDGYAVLDLGPEIASKLTGVYIYLASYDEVTGISILLGRDNDIYSDWDNGIFKDNFRGVWGSIDDVVVFMELTDEADDYQLYTVPVLLNGEEYSLSVSYTYDTHEFEILGARRGLDENGMPDRNLQQLQPGDIIEPLHYVLTDEEDAEFEQTAVGSLTVTEDTRFYETDLGDGIFFFMFEMVDVLGNYYLSEVAVFSVEDGDIYLYQDDDF